jgi:hypothetical protein
MSFSNYDKTTRPKVANEDLEQAKFIKTLANEIAVRIRGALTSPNGDTEVEVTDCGQLEVNEGVRSNIESKLLIVSEGSPQEIKVGVTNLSGRTSVLIQPDDGAFKFGFSSSLLIFKVTKGNFFEIKLPAGLSLWVEPTNGTKKIAIAELK